MIHRRSLPLALAAALAVALCPLASPGQTQIRPRIRVILDTSGSMLLDFPGWVTFGDGSSDGPWGAGWGLGYPGRDVPAADPYDGDADVLTDDSRLFIAKSVLTDIWNSTGDIEFSVERYHAVREAPFIIIDPNAEPYVLPAYADNLGAVSGGIPYFDYFACVQWCEECVDLDFDGLCDACFDNDGDGYCDPNAVADPISYQGFSNRSFRGVCTPEGDAGGDILVDFQNDNQNEILSWIDGQENFLANRTNWAAPISMSHEMRASGFTPLARSIRDTQPTLEDLWDIDVADGLVDQDGEMCRPYYVVVLTDGDDTCEDCGCELSGSPCTQASECCGNRCRRRVGGGTCNGIDCTCQPASASDDACESDSARFTAPGDAVASLCSLGGRAPVGDCAVETYVIGLALSSPTLDDMAAEGGTGAGAYLATDRDSLAQAFSEIIEGTVLVEICDGDDNDCDGLVDEGFPLFCNRPGAHPAQDLCVDPGETVCDGQDDNCNGQIDEGFQLYCNRPGGHEAQDLCVNPGETVCDGADDNCFGGIDEGGICPCPLVPEVCDGLDNDCDGETDEDLTRPCGTDVGRCTAGVETCNVGSWVGCTATGPWEEECNGLDDDCDGAVDGISEACGSDVGECVPGSRLCTNNVWGNCVGGVGAREESCDGLDNDCDNQTDEGLGGGSCGTDAGECAAGTFECVGGALDCQDEVGPTDEVCDGLDNDCDGSRDEGNPGGGAACGPDTDEGACERGSMVCVDGELVCLGGTFPSDEICDGLDNDCDGDADEGDPGGGEPCGDDTGECVPGTTRCVDGELECEGSTGPTDEVCNDLDDDCDGTADEGLGVGAACGEETGECEPGVLVCLDGEVICDGEVGPEDEVCNGLDDDCDGSIDEGLGLGDECGEEVGLCEPGRNQCVDGEILCGGGVPPQEEVCDCDDNDCDREIDENPDEICPPGSRCIECECALPCGPDPEFPCPPGKRCENGWCLGDLCAGVHCEGASRCVRGECTDPCEEIECKAGTRCDENGRCLVDDCFNFPEDCAEDETCIGGDCQPHPCSGVVCAGSEYCRAGDCVASCVGVRCEDGQRCVDGTCEVDPCDGVTCETDRRFCDPATGECAEDECVDSTCTVGHVCERLTGDCGEDPCLVTVCPEGQECDRGVCDLPGGGVVDGPDGGVGKRVLATGGGGCACSATGAPTAGSSALVGLLLAGGLLVFARRRLAIGALTALAVTTGGCDIDPYCIDCPEPKSAEGDGSAGDDAGWITYDGGPDSAVTDAGDPDGCAPDAVERCNGQDDDCDGDIDEGIDFSSAAHCGNCETICTLAHAIPTCTWSGVAGEAGQCGIGQCDIGFQDLDDDVGDGCEYSCMPVAEDDATCDERDDDCDGETDEDVDLQTDHDNCGECGERCTFVHGTGSCVGGQCQLDGCEDGFYDENENQDDGCEYRCGPVEEESCDGRDNDCDGDVDDGDPGGGGGCGSDEGECQPGTLACVGGLVVCQDAVEASTELCNGVDDDCDSSTDESDPEAGTSCGESVGDCVAGVETCVGGDLVCVGEVPPGVEICDGRDNDCDGVADNGDPEGGASCGTDEGECSAGTEHCIGGVVSCEDSTGPTLDVCDGLDNDCDGTADQDFDLENSINNCGQCNNRCSYPNAVAACVDGDCQMIGCLPNYFDRENGDTDGCELGPCQETGNEICNGQDDDCDGDEDEGVVAPPNYCNPNGVCAGTTPECEGGQGWVCNYPGTYQGGGETLCDNRDNDCDGFTDEPFPAKGTECDNGGIGACRQTGTNVCNAEQNGIRCNAPPAGDGTDEVCNGIDDDCDGFTDDGIALADMNAVHITSGSPDFWIFQYEASRPDSVVDDAGQNGDRACSNPDVLPWTDVTETEAAAACCALNADGGATCNQANRWRLCASNEWERACVASADNIYPYGDAYEANTCNGNDWDCSGSAGDQDCLYATGSFSDCTADWGGAGLVYDMSGNVKEWTSTVRVDPDGPDPYEIRGGSYNNAPGGLTCGFDFTLGSASFNFQNLGFRCCYYEQ